MRRQFCDRCGRLTGNDAAFLLPADNPNDHNCYVKSTWFGHYTVTLCDYCLDDFERFRVEHDNFNTKLESDIDWEKVDK